MLCVAILKQSHTLTETLRFARVNRVNVPRQILWSVFHHKTNRLHIITTYCSIGFPSPNWLYDTSLSPVQENQEHSMPESSEWQPRDHQCANVPSMFHDVPSMWLKQCHKRTHHPPVITIFIGGINLPFPVMGGLWHCFNHIICEKKPSKWLLWLPSSESYRYPQTFFLLRYWTPKHGDQGAKWLQDLCWDTRFGLNSWISWHN